MSSDQSAFENQARLRVPPLTGALNFRDMGGYPALGGKTIKWDRLFRSGTTHALTDADLETLYSKGIRYAYDLRSNSERRRFPSRLHEVRDLEYWFRDHDRAPGDLSRLADDPSVRPENTRAVMIALYRTLPYEFRGAYREVFLKLADGCHPLVFNCAAGKDRTGVLAALLLFALGVPRTTIIQDYLMTEEFFEQCCQSFLERRSGSRFTRLRPEIWHPMLHAEADYLDAMFETLESTHGSLDSYLHQELGVDAAVLDRLRPQLLE